LDDTDSADDPTSGSCIHGEQESPRGDLTRAWLSQWNEGRHIPSAAQQFSFVASAALCALQGSRHQLHRHR